jgi:hypothetical protein
MGFCPDCGLRVHCAYEDHAFIEPFWSYCPTCEKADVYTKKAPCKECQGALVEWDTRECPRCHAKVAWDPILAAN